MLDRQTILDALHWPWPGVTQPMNQTGNSRLTITYRFADGAEPGDWDASFGDQFTNWGALSASEKAAYRAALDHVETFLNVDFVETPGAADPDLNVGKATLFGGFTGYGLHSYFFDGSGTITSYDGATVFERTYDITNDAYLVLHEIGHALSLKHTFETPAPLPPAYDNTRYSLMSYDPDPATGLFGDSMALFDILALQARWGAAAYNTGDTVYSGPRGVNVDAIWDTGGLDLLDASGQGNAVTLDLREGAFSRFGAADDVVIAFGTAIEQASGSDFGDRITGNELANLLDGNRGNDVIDGKGGRDTLHGDSGRDRLSGGKGGDILIGGAQRDTFVFAAGGGRDDIQDFQDGVDRILLRGFGFADAAEALALAVETAEGVTFSLADGAVLRVLGVTLPEISDEVLV
jgi:Ca2+-binding RTX toxin-like protein